MKKYFTKVLAIMMLACTPFTFVSCTEDFDWMSLLSELIPQLLGGNGTTTNYDCSGYVRSGTVVNPDTFSYNFGTQYTLSATIPVTVSTAGNMASLVIPEMALPEGQGTADMTQVTLSALALTANTQNTITIDLGDSSTIDGQITVGGVTYTASNAYLENVYVSDGRLNIGNMYLYFGDGYEYCVHLLNVAGSVVTE